MNLDTRDDSHSYERKSTHDQYTEAYIGILNTYEQQLENSITKKNELKEKFFDCIKIIMICMVCIFAGVVILSLEIMLLMVICNSSSVEILVGAIVSIVSSFVTLLLGIYKLPQIIADYLFNKEEDKLMKQIIRNIQKYELNAAQTEKLREHASVDALANTVLDSQGQDSLLEDSNYVNPSSE